MSIVTDEAEDYANSQDYDCCQIIEGAFTVGDAIIEAYAAGRLASSTDAGVEAAADFFTSHLSMLGSASSFIDTGRAKDLARGMLDAARKAINRPATSQIQRTSMGTEWAHGISTYDEVRRISPPHGPQFERKDQSWRQSTRFP